MFESSQSPSKEPISSRGKRYASLAKRGTEEVGDNSTIHIDLEEQLVGLTDRAFGLGRAVAGNLAPSGAADRTQVLYNSGMDLTDKSTDPAPKSPITF